MPFGNLAMRWVNSASRAAGPLLKVGPTTRSRGGWDCGDTANANDRISSGSIVAPNSPIHEFAHAPIEIIRLRPQSRRWWRARGFNHNESTSGVHTTDEPA